MLPNTMLQCDMTPPETAAPPLIAVVDDDAPFLRSVGRLLRSAGFVVETFASGRHFLSSLATTAPRCLVLDIHMPEMSGFELQKVLAAQGSCVPVILMTAHDSSHAREQARKAGSLDLLLKPFDQGVLLRAINEAIRCGPDGPSQEDPPPAK